jgi:Ferritin-like domain
MDGVSTKAKRPSGLTDLSEDATRDISAALNGLLADAFALYLKTKNFHWHVSGSHFRDYHLLLHEQSGNYGSDVALCSAWKIVLIKLWHLVSWHHRWTQASHRAVIARPARYYRV